MKPVKELSLFEGARQDKIRHVLLNWMRNNRCNAFTTKELFNKLKVDSDFQYTLSALKKSLYQLRKENLIERKRTFSTQYWHLKG